MRCPRCSEKLKDFIPVDDGLEYWCRTCNSFLIERTIKGVHTSIWIDGRKRHEP